MRITEFSKVSGYRENTQKLMVSVCACSVAQLCMTLYDPTDYRPPGSWASNFPGKNTGVGC